MSRRPCLCAVVLPALLASALVACSGSDAPASTATHRVTASAAPSTTPAGRFIPVAGQPPVAGRPWFLAIGDSITFGFTVDPARAGVNSSWALQLQGLLAAQGRPWTLYDTACVSERTDTYYTRCPGRVQTPFLADTSQHDAAMAAIATHRADLRAIFVDLGSNDLLRALRRDISVDTAVSGLRTSLTRIVAELRAAAPGVPVILCNYYDPLVNLEPATRQQAIVVNTMVAQVARAAGARVADFYAAINTVPTGQDDRICEWVDCAHGDIHPTVAGQARLAQAALAALGPP